MFWPESILGPTRKLKIILKLHNLQSVNNREILPISSRIVVILLILIQLQTDNS